MPNNQWLISPPKQPGCGTPSLHGRSSWGDPNDGRYERLNESMPAPVEPTGEVQMFLKKRRLLQRSKNMEMRDVSSPEN